MGMQITHNEMDPGDARALPYRVATLERDIGQIHEEIRHIQQEMRSSYVPVSLNAIQVTTIENTVKRIEQDVIDAKRQLVEKSTVERLERDVADIKVQLGSIDTRIVSQGANQKASQDDLQIRVLKYMVGTGIGAILAILTGVFVAIITHRI